MLPPDPEYLDNWGVSLLIVEGEDPDKIMAMGKSRSLVANPDALPIARVIGALHKLRENEIHARAADTRLDGFCLTSPQTAERLQKLVPSLQLTKDPAKLVDGDRFAFGVIEQFHRPDPNRDTPQLSRYSGSGGSIGKL